MPSGYRYSLSQIKYCQGMIALRSPALVTIVTFCYISSVELNNMDKTKMDEPGGPTKPIHIVTETWAERTAKLEDYIRNNVPIEGRYQSKATDGKLLIPTKFVDNFINGGVITVSTENHLLLFGITHWDRFQRLLAKEIGLNPVHSEVSRHIYGNMHRFSGLTDDNAILVPQELLRYAGLDDEVVIIGVVYHAEIHRKESYVRAESSDNKTTRLERFKKYLSKEK